MNSNDIQPPFPLIHVDLNRDPNPSHEFFFPNHRDQPSPLVSSRAVITGRMLFPQPRSHQEHHPHQDDLVDELIIAQGGPHDHPPSDLIEGNNNLSDRDRNHDHGHDLTRDHHHECCSVKWMSSKMRIMKKMTGGSSGKPSAVQKFEPDSNHEAIPPAISDHDSSSYRSSTLGIEGKDNNPTIIRVCADCNTTKTPLWRSGPRGPKSLCNACGIRQRKARRAMALAAAAANGEPPPFPIPALTQKAAKLKQHKKMMKKKRPSLSDNDHGEESDVQPKKKRKGKIVIHPPADSRKLCFEEFRLRLSERISGFQGVFPQDEKEAAILLMALSYGLVQS